LWALTGDRACSFGESSHANGVNMSRRPAFSVALRWANGGLLLLACLMVGCGPPTATLSGTVSFKGQPLPSGTILFHAPDGRVEHSLITEEGHYMIDNAPLGAVRITVQAHAPAPSGIPSRGKPPSVALPEPPRQAKDPSDGKFIHNPAKYLDPAKSGLTYMVLAGEQTHDIELR